MGRRGRRRACRALDAGARGWRADGRGRARTGEGVRGRARMGADGRWAHRQQAWARGRALQARGRARGLGAGRAAWAPGLALGSALGPFSIRFDSFFS